MKRLLTFVLLAGLTIYAEAEINYVKSVLTEVGKASWYGGKFHGKKTASGKVYDMHALTAAHRTLPFGTEVKITNVKNDKSVVVTVNDRGPFVKSREFDLSKAAFQQIGDIDSGVITIAYEILN
ncbi:MAG: septal ring lytic transglycosylase RlpA family protein [Weeksellaceae bacterium]